MIDQAPQIPPAVIQFAEENNISDISKDTIFNVKKQIYGYNTLEAAYVGVSDKMPELKDTSPNYFYENYMFILIDNGKIRLANPKELEELNRVLFL